MKDLFFIAYGAGLQDGLNPCIFMTCAVFIAFGLWIKKEFFVLIYALSTLFFNFGPAQIFIFRKEFIFTTKIIYFVLGVWAFILGILFLKDWFLLHRGLRTQNPADEKTKPRPALLRMCLITVMLAVALSALAALWPINSYILLLGNGAILKGLWQSVMPLLAGYILTSMWPLWLVWAILSIKNLRPSLLKILCASIFLTASSSAIFIFK